MEGMARRTTLRYASVVDAKDGVSVGSKGGVGGSDDDDDDESLGGLAGSDSGSDSALLVLPPDEAWRAPRALRARFSSLRRARRRARSACCSERRRLDA